MDGWKSKPTATQLPVFFFPFSLILLPPSFIRVYICFSRHHSLYTYLMQSNRDLELDLYPYASEVWDMMASFGDTGRVRRTTFRCTCNVCPSKPPSGGSSGSNTRNKQKNEIHYPSAADGGSTSSCCECISPIKLLHNHVKVGYNSKDHHY